METWKFYEIVILVDYNKLEGDKIWVYDGFGPKANRNYLITKSTKSIIGSKVWLPLYD